MDALEILEIMYKNPDVCSWGVRNIYAEFLPVVGDSVEFSWDWDHENDISADYQLCGASCIGIEVECYIDFWEKLDECNEKEVIASIEKALNMIKIYGGETVLVGGDFKGYGEDKGEHLIDGKRYA